MNENLAWLSDVPVEDMRRVVDALYRVHGLVSNISDLDAVLESVMEMSKEVAQAEACSLLLFDEASEELYFHVVLGNTGVHKVLQTIRLKLGQGIAGLAAKTRESVNVEDAGNDPRVHKEADELSNFTTRSILAVPLVERDTLVGVLEVLNKIGGGPFNELDRLVMEMFTSQVATVILSARLIEENLRSERLVAIGQAVAGLSHYTKNILTGMNGSIEIIDLGMEEKKFDLMDKGWGVFKRSVARLSGVVEDMLAYSKSRKPVYKLCNLEELLEDVVLTYEATLKRRKMTLTLSTKGLDRPFYADGQGIHRSVLNLITNAADAIPKGVGRIEIIAEASEENSVTIEVSDNGPGVPEEMKSKIFDPFFSTKGSAGTGLGLAVTHKIVAEHGGEIEIDQNDEGGAVFRIRLPERPPESG